MKKCGKKIVSLFLATTMILSMSLVSCNFKPEDENTKSENNHSGNENNNDNDNTDGKLVVIKTVTDAAGNSMDTKVAGDIIFVGLDTTSLNLVADTQSALTELDVQLSEGEVKEKTLGYCKYNEDGLLESAALQIIMTTASISGNVKVTISGTISGCALETELTFVESKYIPADYVVSSIQITGKDKVTSGNTIQFIAKDSEYGLEQKVEWSIDSDKGSIDENGLYTAPEANSEETEITVTAKYNDTVSSTAKFVLLADAAENSIPYVVSLENESGAWMKITLTWGNATDYEIDTTVDAISDVKLSVDGVENGGVNWAQPRENGVCFAKSFGSANLTNPSVNQVLTFRITVKNGNKYDFTVELTGGNITMTVDSCEIKAVSEITLSESKLVFEAKENQTVNVDAIGISGFNKADVKVESSDEAIAKITYENGVITVIPVEDGNAVISVSYGEYKTEFPVVVQTEMEEVQIKFKSGCKFIGAGCELAYETPLVGVPEDLKIDVVYTALTDAWKNYESMNSKTDISPVWNRADAFYFTVTAGMPDNEEFTYDVSVSFVLNGKKYKGTLHFLGNVAVE